MIMKYFAAFFFVAFNLSAQTNDFTATNAAAAKVETNQPALNLQLAEQIRAECVQGRRIICGKILKVLPGGLVVESGYTDLLRPALNTSWLVPGNVTATRPKNMIETVRPDSPCVGVVFLADIPKPHGAAGRPKPYDYVVLLGYPAGQYTYTSVGDMQKTVRRFSANLLKAVSLNYESAEKSGAAPAAEVK
jgi:hypothetical protein